MDVRQYSVQVALLIDVDDVGERGADYLHNSLEAMAGVAAKGLMDTHSGVRSWVASRWVYSNVEPTDEAYDLLHNPG